MKYEEMRGEESKDKECLWASESPKKVVKRHS